MMVFTVRDSKTEAYLSPFLADNIVTAQRMLFDLMTDGDSMLARHPEDFQLFSVGQFDEQTGELQGHKHNSHGKLIDLKGER